MVKNHLSRLNAPKSWPIKRKGIKFIVRPSAGAHNMRECIPLSLVLKELLKYSRTTKETKSILNQGSILVNGKVKNDHALPVGFMDIISVPSLKKNYRVLYNLKGKFMLQEIDEKEVVRLAKIEGKSLLVKGKVQLNLFDGTNVLLEKNDYKVGDTLVIGMDGKIVKHFKFDIGVNVYIMKGKKVGMQGKLLEVKPHKGKRGANIIVEVAGEKVETAKEYAFVVGDVELKNE